MSRARLWRFVLKNLFLSQNNRPMARRRPLSFRPLFQQLEDRLAPATLIVNTTSDAVHPSDGTLSLRDAISAINAGNEGSLTAEEQNQVSGMFGVNDTIQFNIPTSDQGYNSADNSFTISP